MLGPARRRRPVPPASPAHGAKSALGVRAEGGGPQAARAAVLLLDGLGGLPAHDALRAAVLEEAQPPRERRVPQPVRPRIPPAGRRPARRRRRWGMAARHGRLGGGEEEGEVWGEGAHGGRRGPVGPRATPLRRGAVRGAVGGGIDAAVCGAGRAKRISVVVEIIGVVDGVASAP